MTLAVAASASTQATAQQTVPIVVLGTDALLAALPATPVQLAHACLRAGYANVIPASWGDELIAAAVLRRLPQFGTAPVIQCSCPIVAHRLLTVGGDLRPALLSLAPPPVAIARYVRALSQPTRTRITYVGNCPGANDEAIDIRMRPEAFLAMLGERDILLEEQPRVFESIIPPDRRRFRSQPGGVPSAETLWSELGSRTLVEADGEDFVLEIAQQLLSGKNVLIDVSARLGCACSGAGSGVPSGEARAGVVAMEPPRATTPIVDEHAPIELDLPIPAAPRTPFDIGAAPLEESKSGAATLPGGSMPLGHRISPVRGLHPVSEPRPARPSAGLNPRPVLGAAPVARDVEGRSLPRAYVARRRSSPKGIPVVPPSPADKSDEKPAARTSARPAVASAPSRIDSPADPPPIARAANVSAIGSSFTPRQLIIAVAAIALLTLSISTVVAVIVGRSLRPPPAATVQR
jgi:hypothetical protein